jgi:hypothetical protein
MSRAQRSFAEDVSATTPLIPLHHESHQPRTKRLQLDPWNHAGGAPFPLHPPMKIRPIVFLVLALLSVPVLRSAEPMWLSLWDRTSLTGWHVIGKGTWVIEDGAIHGTNVASEKEFGHLVSDAVYRDFRVRLKFKAVKGNSGFYFRIEETGFSGVSGFQAEIDAVKDVGGLYETNGRSWVVQPAPAQVATWFRPGEWNDMTVTARGGHITVEINGRKSAELADDPGRREGHFALQVHGGEDVDVWFKDIELQILDTP